MKTVEELYTEMLADFEARIGRDMSNSCDLAVRLYAVAAQVQALHAQAEWVERQSFPQTAEGQYLDYHATIRGLQRSPAVQATGTLRFSVRAALEEDLTVPAGTVCLNALDVRYETIAAAILTAGQTFVDVPARAVEAGSSGNTGISTVLTMSVPPAGIVGCTNPTAFTGGEDAESDESLRSRILDTFRRLPNGANAAFYETQAMQFPGVAAAKAIGRARGRGTVDLYVATTAGVPEDVLLEQIRADLAAKREIAVDLEVKKPAATEVDVTASVRAASGYDQETVRAAAEDALRGYFTGERLSGGVALSALYARLHDVEGIGSYYISAPAADVAAEEKTLPILGTLTVTNMV